MYCIDHILYWSVKKISIYISSELRKWLPFLDNIYTFYILNIVIVYSIISMFEVNTN